MPKVPHVNCHPPSVKTPIVEYCANVLEIHQE
jgi:hypothetical protein